MLKSPLKLVAKTLGFLLIPAVFLYIGNGALAAVGLSVGHGALNLGQTENLYYGNIGAASHASSSFLLFQKNAGDIFKIDNFGNLTTSGAITAGAFSGPITGGSINAANVSAGSFGANLGGGNYSFPGNVGITSSLSVNSSFGIINHSIYSGTGGTIQIGRNNGEYIQYMGDAGAQYLDFGTSTLAKPSYLRSVVTGQPFYIHSAADLFLESTSANNVIFRTNGGERLRINSSGDVGIGTTTPGAKLDVQGNMKVAGGSSSNWASLNVGGTMSINAQGSIYSYSAVCVGNASGSCNGSGGTVLGVSNTSSSINFPGSGNSFVNNGGNFGIGTSTPATRLTVIGTGNYSIDAGNFRVGNVAAPVVNLDAANKAYVDSAMGIAQSAFWNLAGSNLYASSTSWNVGIGTVNPGTYKLNVAGRVSADGVQVNNTAVFSNDIKATANTSFEIDSIGGTSYIPYLTDSYADQFVFKPLVSLEYDTTGSGNWVAQTTSLAEALLDNTQVTMLDIPAATAKGFRFVVNANSWLTPQMLVVEQAWASGTPSGAAPIDVTLESSADGVNWTVRKATTSFPYNSSSSNRYSWFVGHVGDIYWRVTILRTDTGTQPLTIWNVRMLSSSNMSRGYQRSLPFYFNYDKSFNYNNGTMDIKLSPSQTADAFRIKTSGGTSLFVVNSAGKVGVGTTSPSVKLDVRGAQNNTITASNAITKILGGDAGIHMGTLAGTPNYGSWIQTMRESDDLAFPLLLNPLGGNVGIGTTSPAQKFHVMGNIMASGGLYVGGGATTLSTGSYAQVYQSNGVALQYWNGSAAVNGLVVNNSGNLMVATTSNLARVNVSGNVFLNDTVITSATPKAAITKEYLDSALYSFGSYWTLSGSNLFASSTTWNVGIGNANPQEKLHISSTNPVIRIDSSVNDAIGGKIRFTENVWQGGYIHYDGAANIFNIGVHDAADSLLTSDIAAISILRANQNVGIGTTTPQQKLHVIGNIIAGLNDQTRIQINANGGISEYYSSEATPRWRIYRDLIGSRPGLMFNDGANSSAIASPQNAMIALYTSGTERLRVDNSGNVGIGTSTTAARVTIVGTGNYSIDAGNYRIGNVAAPVSDQDAVTKNYMDSAIASATSSMSSLNLWGGATGGNIWNLNSGNVGIGITAPSSPLTVSASTTGIVGRFTQLGTWTGSNYALYVDDGDYSYLSGFRIETPGGLRSLFAPGGQAIGFATAGDSAITFTQSTSVERMRIASGGNIGVGTTNPSQKLTVDSGTILAFKALADDDFPGLVIGRTGSWSSYQGRYADISFTNSNSTSSIMGAIGMTYDGYGRMDFHSFYNGGYDATGPLMSIRGTGNIGIGTTTPGTRLTVVGSGNYSIDAGNFRVGNVAAPVSALDAVNKSYLDSAITGIGSGTDGRIPKWNADGKSLGNSSLLEIGGDLSYELVRSTKKLFATSGNSNWFLAAPSKYTVSVTAGGSPLSAAALFDGKTNTSLNLSSPFPLPLIVEIDMGTDSYHPSFHQLYLLGWRDGMASASSNNGATISSYKLEVRSVADGLWYTSADVTGVNQTLPFAITPGNANGGYFNAMRLTISGVTGSTWLDTLAYFPEIGMRYSGGASPWEGVGALGITGGNLYGSVVSNSSIQATTMKLTNLNNNYIPYHSSDAVGLVDSNIYYNGTNVGIGTTSPGTKLTIIGSGNYSIDAGNYRVGNVATPVLNLDAANKAYVDSVVGSSTSAITLWGGSAASNIWSLAAGNVGIGTTNPLSKLVVSGTTDLAFSDTSNLLRFSRVSNVGQIQNYSGGSASTLSLNPGGGNVGIGTTNPTDKLFVEGNIKTNGVDPYINIREAAFGQDWSFRVSSTDRRFSILADDMATEAFTISQTRNIGIGTTVPTTTLDIVSASNITPLQIKSTGITGTGTIFRAKNGSDIEVLTLLGNGNLGLGSTTPSVKLSVVGSGNYSVDTGNFRVGNVATPVATLDAANKAYVDAAVQGYWSLSGSNLYASSTNWNVGIGKTNPGAKLDVNGTAYFTSIDRIGPASNNTERGTWNPIWSSIASGRALFADEEFEISSNSVQVYNNSGGTALQHFRENGDGSQPNKSGKWIRIVNDNSAPVSPGLGGFVQSFDCRRNATFVQRFRAKVPVGYNLVLAENSLGTGSTSYWLTPVAGTGKWEEYIRVAHCGYAGTFSSSGHVYLTGPAGAVTWYLASVNTYEVDAPTGVFSGKVGVGTANPNSSLHLFNSTVNAELDIQSVIGAGNQWGLYSNISDNSLRVWGGSDYLTIKRDGKIGVGTTNPQTKLHVDNSSVSGIAESFRLSFANEIGGGSQIGFFAGSNTTKVGQIENVIDASGGDSSLRFYTYKTGTGLGERMRINNNGYVGIGTTTPAAGLQIHNSFLGSAANQEFKLVSVTGTINSQGYPNGREYGLSITPTLYGHYGSDIGYGLYINPTFIDGQTPGFGAKYSFYNASAERSYFAGNVGIGTTSPSIRLSVVGSGNYSIDAGNYRVGNVATPVLDLDAANKAYVDGVVGSSTSAIALWGGATSGNIWSLNSGNVGIGTTAPDSKLAIVSDSSTGGLNITPTVSTAGVYNILKLGGNPTWNTANRGINFQSWTNLGSSWQYMLYNGYATGTTPGFYQGSWERFSGIEFRGGDTNFLVNTGASGSGANTLITPTKALTIQYTGNIGIGTTNPRYPLEVNGTLYSSGVFRASVDKFTFYKGTTGAWAPLESSGLNIGDWDTNPAYGRILVGTYDFDIWRDDGTSMLKILNGGNVGIGTTTPGIRLTVLGSGNYSIDATNFRVGNVAAPVANLDAVNKSYVDSTILWSGTKNGNIWNGDTGQGKVGIGTTDPKAKLHVAGGVVMNHTTVADSDYTLQDTDYVVGYSSMNGDHRVNVPNALCTPGRFFVIVDESGEASPAQRIIIDPEDNTLIVGASTFRLSGGFNSVYIFCGNNAWYIL